MRSVASLVVGGMVACLSFLAIFVAAAPFAKGDTDVAKEPIALQAVIGDSRVQAFMHPEIADRFPLQVSLPSGVDAQAFTGLDIGVPSVFLNHDATPDPARANLIVSVLDLGETEGTVEFTLPIEGLAGTAQVSRDNGAWVVRSMKLVER